MRYATIVADPPWRQKGGGLKSDQLPKGWGGHASGWQHLPTSIPTRDLEYPTMSAAEIAALPVAEIAAADAHLYLWTTNRYLPDAFEIVCAWGFAYSTTIVWAKQPMGGGLGGKWSITTEFVLHGTRGSLAANGRVTGTWHNWKRPYDERGKPRHSGKPEQFQDLVEQVSPGPYLELFARRQRMGWHVQGNEIPDAEVVL